MRKFLLALTLTCPVSAQDLSVVNIPYWGLDHQTHQGKLIIHKSIQQEMTQIFKTLYISHFPIAKIKPLEDYHFDEKKALEDNDTFGYSCRRMTGNNHKFSKHAYGLAVDINPVFNPYIKNNIILPSNSVAYLVRDLHRPGMILPESNIVETFKKYGWQWGGDWHSLKDYQHFEK
jgi:hypothetical protein